MSSSITNRSQCLAEKDYPLRKGNLLSTGSYVLLDVLTKGIFELVSGNSGLAHFNPKQLMKRPRMAECSALEDASLMPL
jgi:hypothetical protein